MGCFTSENGSRRLSGRRRVDPRRIKIHRSYTVEQLAQVLSCHKNSIWLWLKHGLEPLGDGKRPIMIQGAVARRFLEAKKRSKKRRCRADELYCLRCREPRVPAAREALYAPSPGRAGLLRAICSECGTVMFKRVAESDLSALRQNLNVKTHEAAETPKLAA